MEKDISVVKKHEDGYTNIEIQKNNKRKTANEFVAENYKK